MKEAKSKPLFKKTGCSACNQYWSLPEEERIDGLYFKMHKDNQRKGSG